MGHIRYEVRDRAAAVTIDRPEKRNAMTFAILDELHRAIRRAGADDPVGAVVLTGAGRTSSRSARRQNGVTSPARGPRW